MSDISKYVDGKIYKIVNDIDDQVYVGSSIDLLNNRMALHKCVHKKDEYKNRKLYKHMNDLGVDHFTIKLVEEWECNSKDELRQREEHWRKKLNTTLNSDRCYTTEEDLKEYQKNYHETHKERRKERDVERVDIIKEQNKAWRETNKEKLQEREKNRDRSEYMKKFRSEEITCECGTVIKRCKKSIHIKTKKHLDLMKVSIEGEPEPDLEAIEVKKEAKKVYLKEYYDKHKKLKGRPVRSEEDIKAYKKDWHEKNKEKIKKERNAKVTCECGMESTKANLTRHKKSKVHLKKMEKI